MAERLAKPRNSGFVSEISSKCPGNALDYGRYSTAWKKHNLKKYPKIQGNTKKYKGKSKVIQGNTKENQRFEG